MFGLTTAQTVGVIALIGVHVVLGTLLWRFARRLLNDPGSNSEETTDGA